MPIGGQTPLTTINVAKELRLAYQPLLLAELFLYDGKTTLRLASENLDSTQGGFKYAGKDWMPRLKEQTLGALQSVGDNGIIQLPQVTVTLADADKLIWSEYELPDGKGLKGAKVVLKFVFWDPDTATFSSDEQVKFVGVANAPACDETTVTLSCTNLLNLSNFNLPVVRISRRCPWIFPTTKEQRIAAALDPDSDFYECGYSPDVVNGDAGVSNAGAAARGNLGGPGEGGVYDECDYTREACIKRLGNASRPTSSNGDPNWVQIEVDQSNRRTGHFGGITYDPPASWRSREYISGNRMEGVNNPNDSKYSDYFPMTYGTSFVEPPVMNVVGDANVTTMEVVLGVGKIQGDFSKEEPIRLVLVNDVVVPFYPKSPDKSTLGWNWVNGGDRQGRVNKGPIYDGRGDSYGSLIAITITVPRKVQDSASLPRVRVLFDGPAIRTWSDPNAIEAKDAVKQFTTNAAWILLDLLTWCSVTLDEIDVASFVKAAETCSEMVDYTDLTGRPATHQRYKLGVSLRRRRNAGEIVNSLLAAMKGMLVLNAGTDAGTTGKLQLFIKQTLADQQGAPVPGSNDDAPFISATAKGATLPGYFAYHFDDSNILRRGPDRDSSSTFKIEQRSIADTPGRLGVEFQDEDNFYATDALVIVDSEAIARARQEVGGGSPAEGVTNFDQGKRILQTQFAEQFRGNPRSGFQKKNDSGGTWIAELEASFRVIHLRVGHIVAVTNAAHGLDRQPFRVIALAPSANCEKIRVRLQWHEDDWYLDRYGQQPDPLLQAQRKNRLLRPPFGWCPNWTAPWDFDALYDKTEKTFGLAQKYESGADGTVIAKLLVFGKLPVNQFTVKTSPPFAREATAEVFAGATIADDRTYYLALVGKDATGPSAGLTPPSFPLIKVEPESAGSKIGVPNIYWQPDTAGYKLYAGTNPNKLSKQKEADGTPDVVEITSFKVADESMPDVQFDHLETRVRKVWHSGIFGAAITALSGNVMTISANPGFSLAGRKISVIGRKNNDEAMPVWNFEVVSGTYILTIKDVTDLAADLGVAVGDVIVCRPKPDIIDVDRIGDSKFVNDIDYFDPPVNVSGATNSTPITLSLSTAHNYANDDTVFVAGVRGNSGANGSFTVQIPATPDESYNRTHVILVGSIGDGDYDGGGTIQMVTRGLRPHEEKGREVLIIAGTGRGQRRTIKDNDTTTLFIDGTWSETPDETSVFIVTDTQWLQTEPTVPTVNADPTKEVGMFLTVDNWLEQVLWVQVFSISADGRESFDSDSPGREIYVFGGPGNAVVQYYPATWNVAVSADLEVDDDVAPHYIVRRAGTALNIETKVKVPATGSAIKFDIIQTSEDGTINESIFAGGYQVEIPAGSVDLVSVDSNFRSNLRFSENDILTVNVTQVGSSQAGRLLTIVLKIKVD